MPRPRRPRRPHRRRAPTPVKEPCVEGGRFRGESTIVAPATPPGAGAVSILRLSGPDAFPLARRLTGVDPAAHPPRTLSRCGIRNASGAEIDSGLAVFFPEPHSFTGEDVVEIHLHGNPILVEEVAAAACALGAVPAAPGEFSRRAFFNGKMDLTQAEGLCDLIAARTAASARAALRQLNGGIRAAISPLRERIRNLLVLLEASIDFPEEEGIAPISAVELIERVSEINGSLSRFLESYERGHLLRDGATVAIAGVANVGKSRLLNRLLGEERAIVTETPGTTRDYLSGELVLSGIPVRLVDTAGLRETEDPVEREGVARSRRIVAEADLTLFLLDGSRAAHDGDRRAYDEIASRPHLLLLNKCDLPPSENGGDFHGEGKRKTFPVSAKTGEGTDALLREMARELAPEGGATLSEAPMTRLRHAAAVRRAVEALSRASRSAGEGMSLEFPAADVREAADALSELTGEIAPEEVLDAIFSSFCIGK
ncbi:MAG: tRNA uridine-5-carboxymethylaminomethyl(34) synthesis GTPase MnmE [Deltaproteobacteria bacterium]|nr:MAG: tRNA uridine-5-carboxymethylaminomethyl(34) synthesis GTPase MnmE [Deltaproteobacteria bacterium]